MSSRLHAAAFVLVCVAGAVAAIGLTVREVVRTAPVAVEVTQTTRDALTTTVNLTVRNTTDEARCTTVRVAARDREGRDLGVATAATALRLAPGATRPLTARITLTDREYAERLHAWIPSARACSDEESAP